MRKSEILAVRYSGFGCGNLIHETYLICGDAFTVIVMFALLPG